MLVGTGFGAAVLGGATAAGTALLAVGLVPFALSLALPILAPVSGIELLQRNMITIWAVGPAGQGVFVRRNIATAIFSSTGWEN
jgi:hypothetical protein